MATTKKSTAAEKATWPKKASVRKTVVEVVAKKTPTKKVVGVVEKAIEPVREEAAKLEASEKTAIAAKATTDLEDKKSVGPVQKKPIEVAKSSSRIVSTIDKFQTHKKDTGSTSVQIGVLSKEIADLAKHLKVHAKDYDSRVGLLKKVGRRRRLLNYLRRTDEKRYEKLVGDLKLRV